MATPKVLILCIDGCGPEYLEAGDTPNLTRLGQEGFLTEGRAVIPSVTNVNTTSIATGTFPDRHGITTNYCVDRESGAGSFIEDDRFLLEPTLFQKAKATGVASKAALLVTKGKLLGLLGGGADVRIAAEDPTSDYVDAIGPAEEIYSAEVNLWLLRVLRRVLRDEDPDLTCCFTTDWVQHKHGPNDDVSLRHMAEMDRLIGAIVDDDPGRQIYVTADHGMGSKTRGLDPERWLREGGRGCGGHSDHQGPLRRSPRQSGRGCLCLSERPKGSRGGARTVVRRPGRGEGLSLGRGRHDLQAASGPHRGPVHACRQGNGLRSPCPTRRRRCPCVPTAPVTKVACRSSGSTAPGARTISTTTWTWAGWGSACLTATRTPGRRNETGRVLLEESAPGSKPLERAEISRPS